MSADQQARARRLLERVIEASGLSARQYAVQVLIRDERTIRRWLAGDSPIPEVVIAHLEQLQRKGANT
jgi:hypothetical protein